MKLLIGGDFAPRTIVNGLIQSKDYNFLDGIKSLSNDVDFTIINLECPIAGDTDKPIFKNGPNLKCVSETINALKYAGVDAVTLANNHIFDYGESALFNTINLCKDNGILTVGVGKNIDVAEAPLILEKADQKIGIINCCEHEFSIATKTRGGANHLNPIRQFYAIQQLKKEVDYVVVIVHGGHEWLQLPSLRMKETYQFFINAGADVVLNHHQHCFSGYEIYNGSPIFYGLGNLCFEGNEQCPDFWYKGYMVELDFNDTISFKLHPYKQMSGNNSIDFLEKTAYDSEICELNRIILNEKLLTEALNKFYQSKSVVMDHAFNNYGLRLFRGLKRLGLLPTNDTKVRHVKIANYVNCESQLENVRYLFSADNNK